MILSVWTSGFSVDVTLVLSAPLWCHSGDPCLLSRDCLYSSGLTSRPHASSDEGDCTVSRLCDVHASGAGAPSLDCVSLTWRSRRRYSSWMLLCHRPASSAMLSRALPSSSRQHRSRLRRSDTSCAGGNLLLPPRLQPLSLLNAVAVPLCLPPGSFMEPVAGRTPSLSRPPPNLALSAGARGPETGDPEMEETACREMVSAPLSPPKEGRWRILFRFVLFCCWPGSSGTQNIGKRLVSSVSGSQQEDSGEPCITGSRSSSSLPSRQQWLAQEHSYCPFVEPGKGCSTRAPASSRHTPGCHKPQAGFLCSSCTRRNKVSVTLQIQAPPPAVTGLFHLTAPPRVRRSRWFCWHGLSLVSAPRSVSVASADHQTRLCDSIHSAFPQVQGHLVNFNQGGRCPCLACGNRSPASKGCDRAGPSSRYEVRVCQPLLHCAQEERWDTTNLGSASIDPWALQTAVQDVDA